MQNHCKHKKKKQGPKQADFLSLFSGICIALIPKCPLCIFAYSSAITMCSGAKLQEESLLSVDWFYVNVFLSILTLGLILYNFKGWKTIVSAGIALAACSLLLFVDLSSTPFLYYAACLLLFASVWLNGSFLWFVNRLKSRQAPSLETLNQ